MNRYFYIDSEGKQKGTFSPEELKSENIKKIHWFGRKE